MLGLLVLILVTIYVYKQAKENGRNPILWSVINIAVIIGVQLGVGSRVLRLIAEDKTSREIAEELFVSPRTIETHRTNIAQKLDLRGSHALVKFALSHKSELD